jgi:GH15 family glucan-1,4-alpha-glucosidase
VSTDGTIDFLCLPEFDSPSVFASLLDAERGGRWTIAPLLNAPSVRQHYMRDTNVVVTRFTTDAAELEIIDFMAMDRRVQTTRIVRLVRVLRGEAAVRGVCAPRFDYGRAVHTVESTEGGAIFVDDEGRRTRLTTNATLVPVVGDAVTEVTLGEGDTIAFVLELLGPGRATRPADERWAWRALRRTIVFWRRWIGRTRYRGEWAAAVRRSALALKLLQCRRTGAIIAAPTFGLPEQIGGQRNWDFRYAWIRDASFTVSALGRSGLWDEAHAFSRWVIERCEAARTPGELQSLYRLDGNPEVIEQTLDQLEGYRGSRPVRIGNAAYSQLQLDICGELLDALYRRDEYSEPTSRALWGQIVQLTDWVCQNWRRPDQGIWEVRGGGQEFLYSRVMCWVAVDRALRIASRRRYDRPREQWHLVRDAIRSDVHDNFWNETLRSFVGTLGGEMIDGASLVMPLVGFIEPNDPRWLSTLRAVESRLVRDDLVRRYDMIGMDTDAGSQTAPSFTICSFWYVACLALAGEGEKAAAAMRRMVRRANHVGLFAENLGVSGEQLGNIPQGLPHAALIDAASALAMHRGP